jgi:hypothetical protein
MSFADYREKDILKGYLHSRLNGERGFPEVYRKSGGKEWIQGLSWCVHRLTEDFQCIWSLSEMGGYNDDDELEFPEERREFIKRRVDIEQSWLWKHFELRLYISELPDYAVASKHFTAEKGRLTTLRSI